MVEATADTLHDVGGDGDVAVWFTGAADTAVVAAVAGGCDWPTGCADSWDMLTTAATRTPSARMPSPPRMAETQRRSATASGRLVASIGMP